MYLSFHVMVFETEVCFAFVALYNILLVGGGGGGCIIYFYFTKMASV